MSGETQLEFRLLGPLEARAADRSLPLGGKKQRALLALLLLNANEVVSIDRLIDELWGEHPPATAVHTVRVYVSELRKALRGGGAQQTLLTREPGYVLALEPDQLDLGRFSRLTAEARRALAENEHERAAHGLHEALALWRGPALADVANEPFAQKEIAHLEELHLSALEERIEVDLALGRHSELVAELKTLVAANPLRERLRAQLMLALQRSGRQAEALAAYREARSALVGALGIEPSRELRELEAAILRQDAALAAPPVPSAPTTNLPVPATFLVGRASELAQTVAIVLRPDVRLLSFTGVGGSGKTRLALALAEEVAGEFRDGVFLVELAPLRDSALVLPTIAQTLGLREVSDEPPRETLKRFLQEKELLLLLDNFEHVLAAGAAVAELLAVARRLKVLVTSRASLHVYGEHGYPVPPLAENDAVALFVERARAVEPSFEVNARGRGTINEICRRLDRLPLAVELAAARSKLLSPEAMLARLDQRLELLTGGPRDVPLRQQALRATIGWSYGLLEPSEQTLFARVAVFVGGCTVEAAETVCETALDPLASLADKNLLRLEERAGERRLGMLETVREYALERLEGSGEAERLRERHADYYLALAERAEPELEGAGQAEWLRRLGPDHDNFRAALAWSERSGAKHLELRLAAALARFWAVRGHVSEGRRWLEGALARDGEQPPALRARALSGASLLAYWQSDYERWKAFAEERIALFRQLGDEREIARALRDLGNMAAYEGNYERASLLYEQSGALSREVGDTWNLCQSIANLGALAVEQRDYARAEALCRESLALSREVGDLFNVAVSLSILGVAAVKQRRDGEAFTLFAESLRLSHELEFRNGIGYGLEGLAAVAATRGDAERAARLLAGAEALREAIGEFLWPSQRDMHDRTIGQIRGHLDDELLAAHWAEGRAMRQEDAIDYALEDEARAAAAPA
jgi:predicted ATPase